MTGDHATKWIELNRRFTQARHTLETGSEGYRRAPEQLLRWEDLLPRSCVVILGAAGMGKTRELWGRAKVLQSEGRAAFFLPLEHLERSMETALAIEDQERFAQWKDGQDQAWFFLDSIDELKLKGASLHTALAELRKETGEALGRAHLVLSARGSDWRPRDLEILLALAPY